MPALTIPALPVAAALTGAEVVHANQGTGSVKITVDEIGARTGAKLYADKAADLSLFATATGTGNAITLTTGEALTALTRGMRFRFRPIDGNTGPVTIAVDQVAAVAGLTVLGGAFTGGELTITEDFEAVFDGVGLRFQRADSPNLVALRGLASAADSLPYFTGAGAAALATFTAAARALLDDPTAAAMLATLGFSPFMASLVDDANATTLQASIDLVKQASVTDSTIGRLLTPGAFGLGSVGAPQLTGTGALDAIAVTGYYSISSANAVAVGAPSANGGVVHTKRYSSTFAAQVYEEVVASGHRYGRIYESGAWKPWRRLLRDDELQTSATDTTTGALLTVGAFGLGAVTPPGYTDANAVTVVGTYVNSTSATNIPYGAAGILEVTAYNGGYVTQRWTPIGGSNNTWQRTKDSTNGWTAWVRILKDTDKQANATDATAGKLLTPGAFGLGGQSGPLATDIDAHNIPVGTYNTTSSSLGTFPVSAALGVLEQRRYDSNYKMQRWQPHNSAAIYTRRSGSTSAWTAWRREAFELSDLLPLPGTVGGTADARSIFTGATVAALTRGMIVRWIPNTSTSGGPATLSVDGTAYPLKIEDGSIDPPAGYVIANEVNEAIFDGTNLRVQRRIETGFVAHSIDTATDTHTGGHWRRYPNGTLEIWAGQQMGNADANAYTWNLPVAITAAGAFAGGGYGHWSGANDIFCKEYPNGTSTTSVLHIIHDGAGAYAAGGGGRPFVIARWF